MAGGYRETYEVQQPSGGFLVLDTPAQKLLDEVKLALRVTTSAFDPELRGLIQAAKLDLAVAGVAYRQEEERVDYGLYQFKADPLITRAVILYCKLNFGEPDRVEAWDRLKASYDELKAQLSMSSEYRREDVTLYGLRD